MKFDHYRFSDEADELPQNKPVDPVAKPQRQMYSVHHVRAVIERMNEDSDEELADDDGIVVKGNQPRETDSERVVAAVINHGVMQSDQKKRKLKSGGSSRGSDGSEEQDDEDVEPDSSSDFINQLTTKLQAIATDLEIDDTENRDRGLVTHRNKLSLKKAGANTSNQDNEDRHGANSMGSKHRQSSRILRRASDEDTTKQKPSAMKWIDVTSGENIEDWDRIESLSDSDTGEPLNVKSVDPETPKHASKMLSAADSMKKTPVSQVSRPSSRPNKKLKYCYKSDMLDDSEEITVEEDNSDVTGEDFLSLCSGSPASAFEKGLKGHTPSKKVTASFWMTSPESKKSVYNTDDEFVSNSASRSVHLLLSICVSFFSTAVWFLNLTNHSFLKVN